MSLIHVDARMPSLKDKIRGQAEQNVPVETSKEVEPKEKITKGRRLSK